MEDLYKEAELKRRDALMGQQRAIRKRWVWCVEKASQNAIALKDIRCAIDHQPDHNTMAEMETETVKLDYYDANLETRLYGGPLTRNLPEAWFIKVRTPVQPVFIPNKT